MYGLIDCNNFFVSCERAFNPRLEHQPVAVLSNNDGCVVARSPEFKALGIPMGTPYFKLKPLEHIHHLIFLSSNYELYADLSSRVMSIIRENAPQLEQYSIDEAFIKINPKTQDRTPEKIREFGLKLRNQIRQWVGIPTGVGFAKTRTLAKIATHVAKKTTEGVFVMTEDTPQILKNIPIQDIWGIGARLGRKLHLLGFQNAEQLAQADPLDMKRKFSVCLARTILELKGIPAIPLETQPPQQQSVTCSRTFGIPIVNREELMQAFQTYAAEAAQRLRERKLNAAGLTLFVQYEDPTMEFFNPLQFKDETIILNENTDNTSVIIKAITPAVKRLFREGTKHRKCGVMCFGLENSSRRQLQLFNDNTKQPIPDKLYNAIDAINRQFGKRTLFAAGQGIEQNWKMKRQKMTRKFTTEWDDILKVR